VVSFAAVVAVDLVRVVAAVQGVHQIHSVVVHHTEAVGQSEVHIDQAVAVALQSFSEEVLVHSGHLEHWGNPGLDPSVFLDNLAELYRPEGAAHCDLIASREVENQNHCFQRPRQQLFLLIPTCLSKQTRRQTHTQRNKTMSGLILLGIRISSQL